MISEKCPGLTVVSDDKVASSVKILTNINYMSELCVRTRPIYVVSFPLRAKLTDFDGRSGRSKKIRLATSVLRAFVAVSGGTSTRICSLTPKIFASG